MPNLCGIFILVTVKGPTLSQTNKTSKLQFRHKSSHIFRSLNHFSIYLPNSKVILATLALLKSVSVWNDYLWPLVMTSTEEHRTVQLALTMFRDETTTQWAPMMAAATLISLPMLILFLCCQKYFVQGVVTTGLK